MSLRAAVAVRAVASLVIAFGFTVWAVWPYFADPAQLQRPVLELWWEAVVRVGPWLLAVTVPMTALWWWYLIRYHNIAPWRRREEAPLRHAVSDVDPWTIDT